jgi:hypothetical protein
VVKFSVARIISFRITGLHRKAFYGSIAYPVGVLGNYFFGFILC